ncbi:MAG: amidohydrolase family protein [Pseudomonadota bacterium]
MIREGRVLALGPDARRELRRPATVVDISGCVVLPGFVQSHVRLAHTLLRSFVDEVSLVDESALTALEAKLTPEMMRASARLGLAQCALGGTTSVLDAGSRHHVEALFEAGRETGIRLTTGKVLGEPEGSGGSRDRVRAALAETEKLRKLWHGSADGRLRYAYLPWDVLGCSEELLVEVIGRARGAGCLVHARAAWTSAEVEQFRARFGGETLAHLHDVGLTGTDVVLAHCVWLTARDHKLLKESGTRVAHCPVAELRSGAGLTKATEWMQQGIHVSLGTGSVVTAGSHDVLEALRVLALATRTRPGGAPVDPWQLLEMATLRGAEALGLDSEIGSVQPGKRADLAIIDMSSTHQRAGADPARALLFSARSSDVRHVLVDGQFVVRDRQLVALDQDLVADDAERAVALLRRKQR